MLCGWEIEECKTHSTCGLKAWDPTLTRATLYLNALQILSAIQT